MHTKTSPAHITKNASKKRTKVFLTEEVRSSAIVLWGPIKDSTIPLELIYADDTDFLSKSDQWLAELQPEVAKTLSKWLLKKEDSNNVFYRQNPGVLPAS